MKGSRKKKRSAPVRLPGRLRAARKIPWEERDGVAVLMAPRFSGGIYQRLLRRLFGNLKIRIRLDELGTHVWKRCDGETSLEGVALSLKETFGEKAADAEERMDRFLLELHKEGWIELLEPS